MDFACSRNSYICRHLRNLLNLYTIEEMATKIKHVYGNVIKLAIPLTEQVHAIIDGKEEITTKDFYPNLDYPIILTLDKGGGLRRILEVEMNDNILLAQDNGDTPVGTYQLEIKCNDTEGKPRRFMVKAIIEIVDATADAAIDPDIEFDVATYELSAAVFEIMKGDKGDKGDPGTTDYNELENKPDLSGIEENRGLIDELRGDVEVLSDDIEGNVKPDIAANKDNVSSIQTRLDKFHTEDEKFVPQRWTTIEKWVAHDRDASNERINANAAAIETNAAAISAAEERIVSAEGTIEDLKAEVRDTVEPAISANAAAISENAENITRLKADLKDGVTELKTDIATNAEGISANAKGIAAVNDWIDKTEWELVKTYTVPESQENPALPTPADWDALMISISHKYQSRASGVNIYSVLGTDEAVPINNVYYGAFVTMEICGDAIILRSFGRGNVLPALNAAAPINQNARNSKPYFSGQFAEGTAITIYIKPRKDV